MSTTKALENISTVLSAGVLPEPHGDRRKQAPNDTFKIRSAATSWRSLHRGLYIGECLPLPHKLAKKINRGEFVEMEELPRVQGDMSIFPEKYALSRGKVTSGT